MWLEIVFFIWVAQCSYVASQRQNVSLVELSKCKSYNSFGYGYKSFYIVEDIHHMRDPSDLIHTRIAILAGKDAHILLSETNNPTLSDNVIEIVLGAGTNTYCEIRRKMGFSSIKSRRVLDVLNYTEPMSFVIRVTNSGYIEAKYEGEDEPLISGEYGAYALKLHFLSFCCWGRSYCKFFFDCPNPLYDTLTDANEAIPPLVALERDLFVSYDLSTQPFDLKSVKLGMDIFEVHFDHMQNIMKTRVRFSYEWTDAKMLWQPENYQDVNSMEFHYYDHKTWVPILKFQNVVIQSLSDSSPFPMKSNVYHNGSVRGISKSFKLETWCPMDFKVRVWPHEQVKCHLTMSLANAERVRLDRLEGHLPMVQQIQNSQWNIFSVDMTISGAVTFTITLTRNKSFIDSLFGSPLNFALVMLACSMFVQQSMYRMSVILMSALVLVLTLITLSEYVPPFYTPLIVQYYYGAIIFLAYALICHIITQHFDKYPPKSTPPRWIVSCYRSKIFSILTLNVTESEYNSFTKTTESWKIVSSFVDGLYLICILIYLIFINIMGF